MSTRRPRLGRRAESGSWLRIISPMSRSILSRSRRHPRLLTPLRHRDQLAPAHAVQRSETMRWIRLLNCTSTFCSRQSISSSSVVSHLFSRCPSLASSPPPPPPSSSACFLSLSPLLPFQVCFHFSSVQDYETKMETERGKRNLPLTQAVRP